MGTRAAMLLVAIILAVAGDASGQEPHEAWWNFLQGEWTWEIKALNMKGNVVWSMAAQGNELVGKFTNATGDCPVERAEWRADTKTMVVDGSRLQSSPWQLELQKVTPDTIETSKRGRMMYYGLHCAGTFTGTKIDNNHYDWKLTGKVGERIDIKTGRGQNLEITGKFTRKSN